MICLNSQGTLLIDTKTLDIRREYINDKLIFYIIADDNIRVAQCETFEECQARLKGVLNAIEHKGGTYSFEEAELIALRRRYKCGQL